ncbi:MULTISPECIES: uracil-DNA glycosylase [Rhizobium]|uniref:Type-4 uracil-DNA glycosylase n=1 Tax=Rhizobium rhododendri TaxID=2506430 RepID=A0ABY8IJS5_9HYPH|nr:MULTISPECIES: uracil-DNA glycosylase [Rhizobium]MBZ5761745.1 uracil-DNA glycosylase [Rhizobium sp. VS19-DR96]MBZ5767747.1 uracil-DNA glycosylase [Rhizobium sp. VS19-DR129.2]MBZ5773727.1 uracil-DNA glycosylase [Rhizobium sp. VS19-DRK62.2]MBZ5786364.1 uracil-DNA glycosylase [Rhizobium sp. VS19-DR121]MBZ5802117.1 uracil-DNA glycosylase [Rhizobium sp. VS19-DR181]
MISVQDLSPAELAALLHFHADAGISWMLEEDPVDRFAEFEALKAARQAGRPAPAPSPTPASPLASAAERRPSAQAVATAPPAAARAPAIPDEQAIDQARFAAESARSLPELKAALEAFNGCNLKNSARSTLFASGNPESGIMVIGPMPGADDDREGAVFAGRSGLLLDRMLASIGLDRDGILLTNVIPWRPPGNRAPSIPETDICRPFIERQIALAEPKVLLLLGNFTARFFFGGNETIHALRGHWREIGAGAGSVPAIATLHPQDLLTAPINKRLAWQDLLAFRRRIDAV